MSKTTKQNNAFDGTADPQALYRQQLVIKACVFENLKLSRESFRKLKDIEEMIEIIAREMRRRLDDRNGI
jgi:hypothetical protein